MKRIEIQTIAKKMLADVYTPVGIYLRLRDRFRDTILMESTDFHAGENSYSIIGINAIAGIEIRNNDVIEFKLPAQKAEKIKFDRSNDVSKLLWNFMESFAIGEAASKPVQFAQGLFGYTSFEATAFFENISLQGSENSNDAAQEELSNIPFMRYRLYQYVIVINHYKDELTICENKMNGVESEIEIIESLIGNKDVPCFPFKKTGEEQSNITDTDFIGIVKKGIANCLRGDVFQLVLSRRFEQPFSGDEFNVYRALRSINPSPYLFYFDYGDYKLFGSSPESQLIVESGKAIVHPIAGTYRRTGDDAADNALAIQLKNDRKENAEHVMLVDLARNDLSRICSDVTVTAFKKINYYSHVIHLVSEVTGKIIAGTNPFKLLAATFPAGTLSGAPKIRALQLIRAYETTARGFYGGTIGYIGFNRSVNHAIMIRSFLSMNNTLLYQAGAGVVAASVPDNELQEVHNKLNALKQAIELAQNI